MNQTEREVNKGSINAAVRKDFKSTKKNLKKLKY